VQSELCGTCAYTCVGFLRYLHYYQRYHGHESALKYAAAQRAQAEARMVEQQEAQKTSWIDVQFLKQAAEQVRISCVTILWCGW
jgi:ariadne-1